MRYPAYPRYKPSGIEWLGDVPEHWEVKRLKNLASYRVSNVDKIPSEDELPIRLCNYTDVYNNDFITPDLDLMETTATVDEIRRFGLQKSDVIITKDSEDWRDIAVPALVKETAPDFVCGYHLAILRAHRNVLRGDYLLRAFHSFAINHQFQLSASGVTRFGLPKSSIGESLIPLPDLSEQKAIAAFLDYQTKRIDALVAKKRELIERLKEKRTALISQTVTRGLPPDAARAAGLDPYPKLKPSGIEWLGEIPEHWEIAPLGFHARFYSGATPDKTKSEYWDGFIPWVSPKDMKVSEIVDAEDHVTKEALENSTLRIFPIGVVLIVVRGMILAHSFPVAQTIIPATINQDMKALICGKRLEPSFLRWLFSGFERVFVSLTEESAHGTRKLETEILKHFPILLPPLTEQHVITSYLEEQTANLDALIAKVEEAIERLQEYRTALITAAVTGKIDVRENEMP